MFRRTFLATAIISSLWGSGTTFADEKAKDKVFVGYVFGQPRNINFRLYTHLCHAFLVADGDGKVRESRSVPNRELIADSHKAGVKVLVSLGGWGWDKQFASIVSKPESEERYVKSVMDIIDAADYDGIDLDWEYPDTKEEVVGFERLTRRFRKDLDAIGVKKGRPMVLTMAASSNFGTLKWLDKGFLLETMDWINVMTYDYAGDWTEYAGHHSPLFASSKQPGRNPRFDGVDDEVSPRREGSPRRPARGGSSALWQRVPRGSRMHRRKVCPKPAFRRGTTAICTSSRPSRNGPGAGTMRQKIPGSSHPRVQS